MTLLLYVHITLCIILCLLFIFFCAFFKFKRSKKPSFFTKFCSKRDRIFERFYRVDKSHSNQKKGSGLGLSIVKHGAKFHNAEMEVDSELGKGTKITIIFPKQKSDL